MFPLLRWFFCLFLVIGFPAPTWADAPGFTQGSQPITEGVFPLPELGSDWRTVESIRARVHHRPEDRGIARRLLEHAEEAFPRLASELDLPTGPSIDIILTPEDDLFRNLQPGTPPRWADATAWPRSGMIFLRTPNQRGPAAKPLTQVLDHELVHIILGRAFAPNTVPSWIQEGTAQLLAREYTPALTEQLASGLLGDNLLAIDELTAGFPRGPSRAALAYAQSADLMAHIRTEYGEEGFHELIRQMAAGLPADAAIRMATGRPMTEVDRDWRTRLESRPLWLQAVVNDTSLLAMTGLLFAFGFWSFRKRKKAVLARWAEEEAARDLVYDRVVRYWEHEEPIIMDAATDDRPTTIESGAEETEVH